MIRLPMQRRWGLFLWLLGNHGLSDCGFGDCGLGNGMAVAGWPPGPPGIWLDMPELSCSHSGLPGTCLEDEGAIESHPYSPVLTP
ncbi:hypothetical protein JZ751_004784 [Albula glossodonta]|uniref:Secreted protein n=1 Tax=Albula glossodonta TaxID=121402 RepID=A0A8T2PEN5_9TELE|nr:hypothetical protein JZ751_004784 [Albula glossodonta]